MFVKVQFFIHTFLNGVRRLFLPKLWKYTAKILTQLSFLLIYSFVFELMDENIA